MAKKKVTRTEQLEFWYDVMTRLAEANGKFEWREVSAAIKGTDYEPKNWMDVRGVLQFLMDDGYIARDTSDLTKEIYTLITKKGTK